MIVRIVVADDQLPIRSALQMAIAEVCDLELIAGVETGLQAVHLAEALRLAADLFISGATVKAYVTQIGRRSGEVANTPRMMSAWQRSLRCGFSP
ncbi:hypothetical protein [Nonomuraea sp. NPDC052265]|uniref:hypothetical protein n=1 Tax=Nonomuraea sp. NPDC052265 TaxID=3364374 RepID=UPI0037CA12F6